MRHWSLDRDTGQGAAVTAVSNRQAEFDFSAPREAGIEKQSSKVGTDLASQQRVLTKRRALRGKVAYLSGLSAEDAVLRFYRRQGAEFLDRRWRGPAGEIDLVCRCGGQLRFVEVKSAATHARAAESLRPRQMQRIAVSAECYALGPQGMRDFQIDVALVDIQGRIKVIENALSGFV